MKWDIAYCRRFKFLKFERWNFNLPGESWNKQECTVETDINWSCDAYETSRELSFNNRSSTEEVIKGCPVLIVSLIYKYHTVAQI